LQSKYYTLFVICVGSYRHFNNAPKISNLVDLALFAYFTKQY
jgi:hypothetical protein